jgi:nicotinamide phosphoribosyltransferase
MKNNPLLMTDGYKTSHHKMYPEGTTLVYSNFTPRSVKRMPETAKDIVVFGIQYTIKYINDLYNENFFSRPKNEVVGEAKQFLSSYLGVDYDCTHFEKLHDLGYLPIKIKSLPEGSIITEKIPMMTIYNTHPDFFWLPNFLETLISSLIWKPVHSASLAYGYKKVLLGHANKTDKGNIGFVDFQGHDFSFRGMQHPESAISSGLGFLTSFSGTDTIPTLQAAKYYYGDSNVAFSVPASEHAVMTAYGKENEIDGFKRLMKQYPTGILSVVSDSFDLWQVCTKFVSELKDEIMARDGKLVIRPDSGDPVDILCGLNSISYPKFKDDDYQELFWDHDTFTFDYQGVLYDFDGEVVEELLMEYGESALDGLRDFDDLLNHNVISKSKVQPTNSPEYKGVIELLWDVFGGTINEQGYKVLDSHIGAIYGDSITIDRANQICERLEAKGFASTNVVLGVGSYSMGYATRDNQGGAVKATYVELEVPTYGDFTDQGLNRQIVGREIFKDPITDDGTKKSATGLLRVTTGEDGYKLVDRQTWEEEQTGELKPIYEDGIFYNLTTLTEIRERLKK